jgi:hypothetical protein
MPRNQELTIAHQNSDRNTWFMPCEDGLITVLQASYTRMQRIHKRNATFGRIFQPEVNWVFQLDFFYVSSPVTVVRSVLLLRDIVAHTRGHQKITIILVDNMGSAEKLNITAIWVRIFIFLLCIASSRLTTMSSVVIISLKKQKQSDKRGR